MEAHAPLRFATLGRSDTGDQARLFTESLRQFGGRLAATQVLAYCPVGTPCMAGAILTVLPSSPTLHAFLERAAHGAKAAAADP